MLIRRENETTWRAPEVTAYVDELAIQTLLSQSPELLPGTTGQRLAIAREITLEAGYLDIVGVAPDGTINVIECKLKANPEIGRHVVGQVLAYATGLWGMSYEAFDHAFAARAGTPLAQAVAAIADVDWDEEIFRASVAENLREGFLRLVIAVDEITPELQKIVSFLNIHTTPGLAIVALELRYVADSGVEILFPTVYGEESAKTKELATPRQKWTEERFFAAIASVTTADGLSAARRMYDYAVKRQATLVWGAGQYSSVTARLPVAGTPVSIFSLFEWPKGQGKLAINFEYMVGNVPVEAMSRLAADLRRIPGGPEWLAGLEEVGFMKRPTVPFDVIASLGTWGQIELALDRLLGLELQP